MGRLYSGNLLAFKAACNKLYQLDFAVIINEFYATDTRQYCMALRIEYRTGDILAQETFGHYDEDVLYNTCTDWLNRMFDQLSYWK